MRSVTENSNGALAQEILENVIFLRLKVGDGARGGYLVNDFKGHSTDAVKDCVKSFKSGDEDDDGEDRYELVDFQIIGGGIAPKFKPFGTFLGIIIKRHCKDVCNLHMLDALINHTTGHPFMPSRQL